MEPRTPPRLLLEAKARIGIAGHAQPRGNAKGLAKMVAASRRPPFRLDAAGSAPRSPVPKPPAR